MDARVNLGRMLVKRIGPSLFKFAVSARDFEPAALPAYSMCITAVDEDKGYPNARLVI